MSRILIVDDEENILRALRRVLAITPCVAGDKTYHLTVDLCLTPEAALVKAGEHAYDLILSDFRMPGMDGVELLKAIRKIQPDAARVILSGYADLNGLVAAINEAQIARFIAKPWSDYDLMATIGQVLAIRELQLENSRIADETRVARGQMDPEELERKRLEAEEPGITQVTWGEDGSVILDPDLLKD
jgi:YesN/AraC family two-component response regulator